jgi:large subunit ribosomal protein L24
MARHVKRGDLVMVRSGDDRGKTGKVLRVVPKDDKVVVEGINVVFRHVKPSQKHPQGGRIQKEMPIHISKVSPVDPDSSKATRVRFPVQPDGSKLRVAVKGGKTLGTLRKAQQG